MRPYLSALAISALLAVPCVAQTTIIETAPPAPVVAQPPASVTTQTTRRTDGFGDQTVSKSTTYHDGDGDSTTTRSVTRTDDGMPQGTTTTTTTRTGP